MSAWPFSRPAGWAREVTARTIGPFVSWLMRGPSVVGREHVDSLDRPFLICPNHASHLDSSALRLAIGPHHRRRLAIAAAADYWWRNSLLGFLAGWLGSFPFNRTGRGGLESLRAIEHLLQRGWNVLIYPEGTRSRTGQIGAFRPGAGFVAVRTGCPVVPVRIDGIAALLPAGSRLPRRTAVVVRFGQPLIADSGEDARAFAARLEASVRAL